MKSSPHSERSTQGGRQLEQLPLDQEDRQRYGLHAPVEPVFPSGQNAVQVLGYLVPCWLPGTKQLSLLPWLE